MRDRPIVAQGMVAEVGGRSVPHPHVTGEMTHVIPCRAHVMGKMTQLTADPPRGVVPWGERGWRINSDNDTGSSQS